MQAAPSMNGLSESIRAQLELSKLQELFNVSFAIWQRDREDEWQLMNGEEDCNCTSEEILNQVRLSKGPVVKTLGPGRLLLGVPLPKYPLREIKEVAVGEISGSDEQATINLATLALENVRQEAQLERLTQENATFLRQVSEDFEELAFLRTMAQRLVLDSHSHDLIEVIDQSLPLIGEAIGVEHIYYVALENGKNHRVAGEWHLDPYVEPDVQSSVVEQLVTKFEESEYYNPIVKNHVQKSDFRDEFSGVREFILVPLARTAECHGCFLAINRKTRETHNQYESICKLSQNELGTNEASLLNTASAMIASHAHNLALLEERELLLINVVQTLVSAIDSRDPYTCGHSERVAQFGKLLAEELGFDEVSCERLYLTGLLHDLGKIGVSDAVLNKKGALTDEEFAEIQEHPDLGWSILRELEQLDYVLPGVLHHHERYDGKGYPDGLVGEDTPLDGRLLAVVDAFDAMTSDRPYRKGMPVEKATQILKEGAGTQWDREIVDVFLETLPRILEAKANYQRPPMPMREPGLLKDAVGALNSVALRS